MQESPFLQHIWVVFLSITAWQAGLVISSRGDCTRQPHDVRRERWTLFWLLLVGGALPWVIMGVQLEFGFVNNIFAYLGAGTVVGAWHVTTWWASVAVVWMLGLYWIVFNGGAGLLVRHRVSLIGGVRPTDARSLKVLCFICAFAALLGLILSLVSVSKSQNAESSVLTTSKTE